MLALDSIAATHLVVLVWKSVPAPSTTFLSYSRSDLAAADELRGLLSSAGLDVFKDDATLRSGDRWIERLQAAVATCGAFVVLVGRDGVQRWVGAEVEVALNRNLSPHGVDAKRLPIRECPNFCVRGGLLNLSLLDVL